MLDDSAFYPDPPLRLDTVPAIIVHAPSWNRDVFPKDFANQVGAELLELLEASNASDEFYPLIQYYQIGSAAEWSRTLSVVFEFTEPIADYLSNLVTIASPVLDLVKFLRSKSKREVVEHSRDDNAFPPISPPPNINLPLAIGIAANHYRLTYGSLGDIEIFWNVRATARTPSIEAPIGDEVYSISFTKGQEHVVYTINGLGRCIEHLYASPNRIHLPELPDFLGEDTAEQLRNIGSSRIDRTKNI